MSLNISASVLLCVRDGSSAEFSVFTVLITLCGATYFFVEATKRGQNPWKWAVIAITVIMGPLVVLGWYVVPITLELLGFYYEGHLSSRLTVTVGLVATGIYLFFLARMRLVRYPKLTEQPLPTREPEIQGVGSLEKPTKPNSRKLTP